MERRKYITTAGAITGTALAGCFDGDGGGDGGNGGGSLGDIITLSFEGNTSTYAFVQGLSAFFTENIDEYEFSAKASSSISAIPRGLAQEDIDIAPFHNVGMSKKARGVEPYNQIDQDFYQVFHMYQLLYVYMTAHLDWESVNDIASGSNISPGTRGSPNRDVMEHVLNEYVGLEYTADNVSFTEQPSALNEGRLDVGGFSFVNNGGIIPGWLDQGLGQVDLNIMDIPDEAFENRDQDDNLFLNTVEASDEMRERFNHVPEDPVQTTDISYNFTVRAEMDYDVIKRMMEVMFENREGLSEYHGMGGFFSPENYWTQGAFPDVPFHPAAADFYQENGLWKDEFERGEER